MPVSQCDPAHGLISTLRGVSWHWRHEPDKIWAHLGLGAAFERSRWPQGEEFWSGDFSLREVYEDLLMIQSDVDRVSA